jgi:hypothetical protein
LTLQGFNDSTGARSPLFADQNQNPRYERHNSHHDCSDADVKERSDSDEDEIDREQQHSNVFCDHASVLKEAGCLCTQKNGLPLCGVPSIYTLASSPDALFLLHFRWNKDRFAHAV